MVMIAWVIKLGWIYVIPGYIPGCIHKWFNIEKQEDIQDQELYNYSCT